MNPTNVLLALELIRSFADTAADMTALLEQEEPISDSQRESIVAKLKRRNTRWEEMIQQMKDEE